MLLRFKCRLIETIRNLEFWFSKIFKISILYKQLKYIAVTDI